jgi:hypothetical protein
MLGTNIGKPQKGLPLCLRYHFPEGRTVMSGISNGGSGAFRFNCEHSELIDGLVIGIQAWFDPYVGYFDCELHDAASASIVV